MCFSYKIECRYFAVKSRENKSIEATYQQHPCNTSNWRNMAYDVVLRLMLKHRMFLIYSKREKNNISVFKKS